MRSVLTYLPICVVLILAAGWLFFSERPTADGGNVLKRYDKTPYMNDGARQTVDNITKAETSNATTVSAPQALESVGAEHPVPNAPVLPVKTQRREPLLMLKDVGEPYLYHFGLEDDDFRRIAEKGVALIEGNFDICASDEDVSFYLDTAARYGIAVVMPAGAGEAEWGYQCDEAVDPEQIPRWRADAVKRWVERWRHHPAIYAWDISNEAGGNFPNAGSEGWERRFALTVSDLRRAYADVKSWDPLRPILIRMNGWYFYDYDHDFFRAGNPFAAEVADIVMINTYSNVEDYYDDFVETVARRAKKSIRAVSPNTRLIIALGAWREPPLWYLPTRAHFAHDRTIARSFNPLAIAVFKYGARDGEWWMPRDAREIWNMLSSD